MHEPDLEVDYLIMGAGACGMAFADSLVTHSKSTMAIVDRQHRPGGHWNSAYPFVRLHQPSAFYGVNSRELGSNARDQTGLNKGFYELASGAEVSSYFDNVMRQQFLPTGRVHYLPMSEVDEEGIVTSRISGRQRRIKARKIVDASFSRTVTPAMRPPPYSVAEGVTCVPSSELPRMAAAHAGYVVVGSGKTGMDACLWLLENGADPDSIRWVMPRDYWWINRETYQPGEEFFPRLVASIANGVQSLAEGRTVDEVFELQEQREEFRRIDPTVRPEGFHGGFVSDSELAQLRRIRNIVRLGRVRRIDPHEIVLDHGSIPTSPQVLHVDCSAIGIPPRGTRPIFDGNRITPQWVRLSQPTFSWSLVGHVEATMDDEEEKNRICRPIPAPDTPKDWVRMMAIELANQYVWSRTPLIREWQFNSRLDPFTRRIRSMQPTDTEASAHLERYGKFVGAAAKNAARLLAD